MRFDPTPEVIRYMARLTAILYVAGVGFFMGIGPAIACMGLYVITVFGENKR